MNSWGERGSTAADISSDRQWEADAAGRGDLLYGRREKIIG